MKEAEIRCKNFKCQYQNEKGKCTAEGYSTPCIMGCVFHSDCRLCVTDCKEEPDEEGYILK